jgi:hypothetical protein
MGGGCKRVNVCNFGLAKRDGLGFDFLGGNNRLFLKSSGKNR